MSCWRAPALMRTIQRRRKSRFLFLRSRYAYFQPRSTFSFAAFHSLLRAPNPPRAAFITCFFRLRRGTFDTARGIGVSLGLDQALDALGITDRGHDAGLAEAALPLGGLLGEDVALERLVAANLSGPGHREALRRAAVGFHFWHICVLISAQESSSWTSLPTGLHFRSCRRPSGRPRPARARPDPARGARPAAPGTSW